MKLEALTDEDMFEPSTSTKNYLFVSCQTLKNEDTTSSVSCQTLKTEDFTTYHESDTSLSCQTLENEDMTSCYENDPSPPCQTSESHYITISNETYPFVSCQTLEIEDMTKRNLRSKFLKIHANLFIFIELDENQFILETFKSLIWSNLLEERGFIKLPTKLF